jgi:hypothetical protein
MTDSDSPFLGRREMSKSALLGGASFLLGARMPARAASAADREHINVRDFGAQGDGKTDDTKAIQRALEAAGEVRGVVLVPPGAYLCADLQMRPHSALLGTPTWNYQVPGGTVLRLSTDVATAVSARRSRLQGGEDPHAR